MKNKFFLFYHVSLLQSTHSEIYRDISPSRKQDKKEEGSSAPLFFLILFSRASLLHLNDLDLAGGEAGHLCDDVHDAGGVRLRDAALRRGHRQADALVPDEGHAVRIALGHYQVLDLGLGDGVCLLYTSRCV